MNRDADVTVVFSSAPDQALTLAGDSTWRDSGAKLSRATWEELERGLLGHSPAEVLGVVTPLATVMWVKEAQPGPAYPHDCDSPDFNWWDEECSHYNSLDVKYIGNVRSGLLYHGQAPDLLGLTENEALDVADCN